MLINRTKLSRCRDPFAITEIDFVGPGLATADDCDDGEEVSRVRLRYPKHLLSDDDVYYCLESTESAAKSKCCCSIWKRKGPGLGSAPGGAER